ncbi:MAG: NmrA/HSCARG family protein [Syntrophothermus sp.]
MEKGKIIFVTGATGQQGSAVVRHLVRSGFNVRALTRSSGSKKTQSIMGKGVEMVEGDLFRPETFEKNLSGAYGLFSVQNFWEHGFQGEITQGKLLVDLAKKAGIKHFVYSSVASANKNTGLSHFDSKFNIENYIRQSGIEYTIFRPVFFMENFLAQHNQILEGRLVNALSENTPLQMIAVSDIGEFVAQAFLHPDIFRHKEIDIAGDSKTMPEVAQLLSEATDVRVNYVKLDMAEYRNIMGDEYANMAEWFEKVGYDVNIEALRENYDVELTGFRDWLKTADFEQFKIKQHQ